MQFCTLRITRLVSHGYSTPLTCKVKNRKFTDVGNHTGDE